MRTWSDEETGVRMYEPDCVDEYLWHLWAN